MISNVFDAVDFMNTSPKNYIDGSQKEEYKDTEEYIDFAVIEIDFEKLNPSRSNYMKWKQRYWQHYT